ncbi:MAG: DUF2752 domain-containing protein [Flavobacteriales bacterium]
MKRNYYLFYGLLFFLALFYAFVNPFERNTNLPGCFIYEHTGIFCPGCGLQRALHAFFYRKNYVGLSNESIDNYCPHHFMH